MSPILAVLRERQQVLVLRAFVIVGLLFMLLPGTFLGVWNLLSISSHKGSGSLSAAWLQAHGHAQIFGWIGSFIIGIGFYSLPSSKRVAIRTAWFCWSLWIAGVSLRWVTSVYGYEWRLALPLSAALELIAFLIFYRALSQHRPPRKADGAPSQPAPAWIRAVLLGTLGFGVALFSNLFVTLQAAIWGAERSIPATFNQRWLVLVAWGFIVPTVFGFTARWVPVFIGSPRPQDRPLKRSLALVIGGITAAALGWLVLSSVMLLCGSLLAIQGLCIFASRQNEAKTRGVHPSMPTFIRLAYAWLLVGAVLGILAALFDHHNGYWGASRHALTVGFFATMIFSIGPRILPHFSGVKRLFSTKLMLASLLLITTGCALRVVSEPLAYESAVAWAWSVLPASALAEMAAVTLFAINIVLSIAFSPTAFVDTSFVPQAAVLQEN